MKKRNPVVDKKVKDIFPSAGDVKAKSKGKKPAGKVPAHSKGKMPC